MPHSHADHQHHHTEEVLKHLTAVIENLQVIKNMIGEERPCLDVLNQMAGVFVRLNECRMTIVHDHISSCLAPALKPGQENLMQEVEQILRQGFKGPATGSFH
jgi:DNA-binding FrmR family transcriptional regulator